MNTRIEMDKVDYSEGKDILKELYNGSRQVVECKWEDFFNIPLTEEYAKNNKREFDFNSLKPASDLSNNNVTISINEQSDNK